jgi:hypothetical protein
MVMLISVLLALTVVVGSIPTQRAFSREAIAITQSQPPLRSEATQLRAAASEGRELLAQDRLALAEAHASSFADLAEPCSADGVATSPPEMPAAEAMDRMLMTPAPMLACCRVCTVGIACGNTCISARYTCHVGVGCACNAGNTGSAFVLPPLVTFVRQSPYPRLRVGDSTQLTLTVSAFSPSWLDGDVEVRVANPDEASQGLRGWDDRGLLAINRADAILYESFTFHLQALAPGVHRLRIALFHRTLGQIGPSGIYWDVAVDPLPNVQRLYEGWHSRWVTQSSYLALAPGQSADFWIRFANVGTEFWRRGFWGRQANLGLNGDDRSPYALGMAADWLWEDRIATTTALVVAPGEVAEFRFKVRAPLARGIYYLNLRPVVDGTSWLEDEGVFWLIEVK